MIVDWEQLVVEAFARVKAQLEAAWPLEADGSGPPERVAMQTAIKSMRPRMSVVILRVERPAHLHLEDGICPVLVYDFCSPALAVNVCVPELAWTDTDGLIEILSRLELPFAQSFADDLHCIARGMAVLDSEQSHKVIQFLPYDPRGNPGRFAADMYLQLRWWLAETVEVPDLLADYAVRFGLSAVPMRPDGELLQPDRRWRAMARWRGSAFAPTAMADLARDVAGIPLIAAIPEDVQVTFRRAMALYVYSYLHYDFLTLVPLVAFMALEAAVRHRWCQTLRVPVTLRFPPTRKKPETIVTFDRLTYERAIQWGRPHGRPLRHLLVNDQPFPATFGELLNQLREQGIITLWERKQTEQGWELRGDLAHPEEASTLLPGSALQALRRVAQIINRLFDPEMVRL